MPADVSDDTPRHSGWGDSVIEGGEIPLIAGRGSAPLAVTPPAPRRQAGPAEPQAVAISSRSGRLADVP